MIGAIAARFAQPLNLAAGAAAGALVAWLSFSTLNALVWLPDARKQATAIERSAWGEAMDKLRDKIAADKQAAQDAADAIERDYLAEKAARLTAQAARDDLEAALKQSEENRNADDETHNACAGRPAISRGVSNALDKIGRDRP